MAELKSTPDAALPEPVLQYLDRTNLQAPRALVLPLTGDASDRRYFRVLPRGGGSFVLALHAAPFSFDTLPFVNVAGLLAKVPVPIPAILGHAEDLGILELQDLGDVTLQAHLGSAAVSEHTALYREAIRLVAAIQRRGSELASDQYVPYGIAFDVAKLTWEFEFFLKHFVVAYRGAEITPADREALTAEFAAIVQELAGEARVLCHRDYHSRNLMWRDGRLFIIDFQDARMGPDTYDLVSLLQGLVRRHQRGGARGLHRLLPGVPGRHPVARRAAGVPPAVRPDGAAAEPQGPRHLRLPDGDAPQPRLHPVHAAHAALRPPQHREVPAFQGASRGAGPLRGGTGRMSTVLPFGVSTQLYHAQRLRHDHLAEVAAQGFDAVEIIATRSHVDYHDPDVLDAVAGWLTREGLRLHSMHAPVMERFDGAWVNPLSIAATDDAARAQAVRETAAALELARRVPMSVLVVHPGLQDSLLSPSVRNSRRAVLRSVEEIVALASPLGVRVALEVIPNAMSTAGALVAMIEELDMPDVGVCLDFGHAHLQGDVVEAIETLSGVLIATHVHDNRGQRDEHLAPYEGTIDWAGALLALQKIGYDGTMMLELASAEPSAPALERARQAVARLEDAAGSWT